MARRKTGASRKSHKPAEKLVVRKARPEDRDAILAIAKRTWGGADYLPLVWDRWLADEKGTLLTATLDGKPVGMSKITLLSPGEVWLEGLRLSPDLQGRGLSRQINRATFREALSMNPKSVRFSTAVMNTASRHLAEKRGFWQIARARWMWGAPRKRGQLRSRVASPTDLDRVERFVRDSECYERASGLQAIGWKFRNLSRRRLRRSIADGNVLVLPARGAPRAVGIYEISPIDNDVCLGFADGSDEDIAILARDVLRIAGRLGHDEVSAMLPEGRIADAARRGGFSLTHSMHAIVFELGPKGRGPDDELLEPALWRTLRANESEIADLLTDVLRSRLHGASDRENVRDFVFRNLLPDTEREVLSSIQPLCDRAATYAQRGILRGLTEHLATNHGLAGESLEIGKSSALFFYRGGRLAALEIAGRAIKLTLGPGFGACFSPRLALDVHRMSFPKRSLDPTTGRHTALTLWLTEERQIPGAAKAIDIIMRSAIRG